jgi:hypothetical protein
MQGDELNKLKSKEIELLQEMAQVISNKNKVEARLNQTQFPFGKLPISLDESVAAFPIALGIGFLVYVSLLSNVIRLRRELHIWYKMKDEGKNALEEQKISLLAPLWVYPIDTKVQQSLRFIILLIPFIIFIVSCYLTSYYIFSRSDNQIVTAPFTYESFNNVSLYAGLYCICFGLFVYGFWSIIHELRNYKNKIKC